MTEASGQRPRVLVVGCGAIGGTLLAHLVEADRCDAVGVTSNPSIAAALVARGVRLEGYGGSRTVPLPDGAVGSAVPAGPFDFVVIATQPVQFDAAVRDVRSALTAPTRLVVLQNGLCEERAAAMLGPDRVLGAVVAWGASMPEPGRYERTSAGGFVVGRLDGREDDPALPRLSGLLAAVGPVRVTPNLRGARWSKLAINCAISTLGTLGGDRLGALMRHGFVRALAMQVMGEVVAAARLERVRLEKVSGTLDLDWLCPPDGVGALGAAVRDGALVAVGLRYRHLRSSMLAAIERGRPPSVDFLNGEVVTRARAHGRDAPANAAARDAVHEVAAGRAPPSLETLRAVYDRVRTRAGPDLPLLSQDSA